MAVKRQTLLLGAAGVLAIVAVVIWSSGGSVSTAPASGARRAPAAAQATPSGQAAQTPDKVKLESLKESRNEPIDGNRNPFRFRPPPAPKAPEGPPPKTPNGSGPVDTGPVVPTGPPPPPPGPLPPPPIPLKFIGVVTQGAGRVAVLSDGKSAPVSGREGAIILGQYVILKIGNESIEMAYVDGRGRRTIQLTGQ